MRKICLQLEISHCLKYHEVAVSGSRASLGKDLDDRENVVKKLCVCWPKRQNKTAELMNKHEGFQAVF